MVLRAGSLVAVPKKEHWMWRKSKDHQSISLRSVRGGDQVRILKGDREGAWPSHVNISCIMISIDMSYALVGFL